MKRTGKTSAVAPSRPDRRGDAPGPRCDQAERPGIPRVQDFRTAAQHIATQLDHAEVAAGIEAAMWRMLDQEAER